ncbi:hypothetical protein ACT8ZS_05280 [Paenibacillus sp. M.A.Huq-84]
MEILPSPTKLAVTDSGLNLIISDGENFNVGMRIGQAYKDKLGEWGLKNDNPRLTKLIKEHLQSLDLQEGMKGCFL